MSDIVSMFDNVVITLEPGGHEYAVPPRVAAYINRLQRENAQLRAVVARELPESSERQFNQRKETP